MDYTESKIKTLNSYSGVTVNVTLDTINLPDGNKSIREKVHHSGGVCVLAIDENKNAICVRQFRYCIDRHTLEIPAGKLEKGEDPYECAVRELSEETGVTAKKIVSLGEINPSPGFCNETIYIYLATELEYGQSHPDEGEFLDVIKMPLDELHEKVMNGEIKDGKTVVAILKAKNLEDFK